MTNFEELIARIPGHWNMNEGSNNYNAVKLVSKLEDDLDEALNAVYKLWHIDTSYGQGLDDIGHDLGLPRDGMNDEDYRKFLKIKELLDNSNATINDIDTILDAYLEGHYRGLKEGWNSELKEPAAIVLEVTKNASSLPFKIAQSAKSGGVRVYYEANFDTLYITVYVNDFEHKVYYNICNTFNAGYRLGIGQRDEVEVKSTSYEYKVYYPVCGNFVAG